MDIFSGSVVSVDRKLSINDFQKAASLRKNDAVLTMVDNGKTQEIIVGRPLKDRFIIFLRSTCIGEIGFIKRLHENIEGKQARAVESFTVAMENIYGKDCCHNFIKEKKVCTSDIKMIIKDVIKTKESYKKCHSEDIKLKEMIVEFFPDFEIKQLNNNKKWLYKYVLQTVNTLIDDTSISDRLLPENRSHLEKAVIDFIIDMPASSNTFMGIVTHRDNPRNNTEDPIYKRCEINIPEKLSSHLTAEDMGTLLKAAGNIKDELLSTGSQEACRHQVYAVRFNEAVTRQHVEVVSTPDKTASKLMPLQVLEQESLQQLVLSQVKLQKTIEQHVLLQEQQQKSMHQDLQKLSQLLQSSSVQQSHVSRSQDQQPKKSPPLPPPPPPPLQTPITKSAAPAPKLVVLSKPTTDAPKTRLDLSLDAILAAKNTLNQVKNVPKKAPSPEPESSQSSDEITTETKAAKKNNSKDALTEEEHKVLENYSIPVADMLANAVKAIRYQVENSESGSDSEFDPDSEVNFSSSIIDSNDSGFGDTITSSTQNQR